MRNKEERLGINPALQDSSPPEGFFEKMQEYKNNQEHNQQLSFIVPTEVIDLPSKGFFYPEDHPLHLQDSLEIKQMTAKEEDILTSKSLLKKGIALDRLIQSVLVNKNIDPDTLTLSDRNSIIVSSRISGYGPEYLTQITCPACSERVKHKFNLLEKIENYKDKSLKADIDNNGLFQFELPVTKWKVVCKALTGADEKTISRSSEIKKKNNSQNDSLLFDQLKCMTVSIQGVYDKAIIEKALLTMPARDSKYIRTVYQHTVEDVNLTRSFTCPKCDYEVDLEVPLSADFFWFE